jgi:hypothetical protein
MSLRCCVRRSCPPCAASHRPDATAVAELRLTFSADALTAVSACRVLSSAGEWPRRPSGRGRRQCCGRCAVGVGSVDALAVLGANDGRAADVDMASAVAFDGGSARDATAVRAVPSSPSLRVRSLALRARCFLLWLCSARYGRPTGASAGRRRAPAVRERRSAVRRLLVAYATEGCRRACELGGRRAVAPRRGRRC